MASLLAIFILALIVMMIQLQEQKEELERERDKMELRKEDLLKRLKDIRETQSAITGAIQAVDLREQQLASLLQRIQQDLSRQGIRVKVVENGLRIPESALHFRIGGYEIQEEFRSAAEAIGLTLLKSLNQDDNLELLDTVFIEGHTDNVPNVREMGNWGLSTYRAISLWQFWTEDPGTCKALKDLKTPIFPGSAELKPLISVSGYADTRPSGELPPETENPNGRDAGNPSDRRIDIRFTLTSSEKKNLETLQSKMNQLESKTEDLIQELEAQKG